MANISITSVCNRSCSYCFAREAYYQYTDLPEYMSIETYSNILDFLDNSAIEQVRLLGGEPTLHPEFQVFLQMAMERNKKLFIFSNGIISEYNLKLLSEIPSETLSILINISISDSGNIHITEEQKKVLFVLGNKVMAGLNIYKPNAQLDNIIEIIENYNLRKSVRLGLAHTCLEFNNIYLKSNFYEKIGEKIVWFSQKAGAKKINISFDCGFVPCMFSNEDIKSTGFSSQQIGLTCGPIIDILSDGSAIPCYPLAKIKRKMLSPDDTLEQVINIFKKDLLLYRSAGIYRECSVCNYRKDEQCQGGCLSLAMQRFKETDFSIVINSGQL